jgi:hypothetical protein
MFAFSSLPSLPSDDVNYVDMRGSSHIQQSEVVPVYRIRKLPRTTYVVCLASITISYTISDV